MVLATAYGVFLLFTGDRLLMLIGGIGGFAAFCIGGTLGKSAFDAWRNNDPAVIVDREGLDDVRGGSGVIPWSEIEKVRLDLYENRILVNFAGSGGRSHSGASTVRRLFAGADCTITLRGLSYDPRELAKALAEHHRRGRPQMTPVGNPGGPGSPPTQTLP